MESSTTLLPRQCKATTKGGRPCHGFALQGSDYCFAHDPALAEKRKIARSKGGKARHGRKLGTVNNGQPVKINDLSDVVRVLADELGEVLCLERSISRARAVGYLCSILASIYQASELEQRIAALEQQAGIT